MEKWMPTWILCGDPMQGPVRDKVGSNPVIGPFEDEATAKEFATTDPLVRPHIVGRKLLHDPTPEERSRAITPREWTIRGRELLGAVWIKPREHELSTIGPFDDEAQATQFASEDSLLKKNLPYELRRGITPNDLLYAKSPADWSRE